MSNIIDNLLAAHSRVQVEEYSRCQALLKLTFVFSWSCDYDSEIHYEVRQDTEGAFVLSKSLCGGYNAILDIKLYNIEQIADEITWCLEHCEHSNDTVADSIANGEMPPEVLALIDEYEVERIVQDIFYMSDEGKDVLVMSKLLRK